MGKAKEQILLFTLYCSLLTVFTGCSRLAYWQARTLENQARYVAAARAYDGFSRNYPGDEKAAQAIYRAGRIFQDRLGLCQNARPLFEKLIRSYPNRQPWARLSREALFDCEEYFPLRSGAKWVVADSETEGRNMRQELECSVDTSTLKATVSGWFYAGRKRFRKFRRIYSRRDWSLEESEPGQREPTVILRYPFLKGESWVSRRNSRAISFEIVEDHVSANVRAGMFSDCLKVKERVAGLPSWKYDYYAPHVGRVLTTVAGPGYEHRNTELLSYEVPKP